MLVLLGVGTLVAEPELHPVQGIVEISHHPTRKGIFYFLSAYRVDFVAYAVHL